MDRGRRRPAKRCSELLQILPNNDSDAAEMDNDESGSEADWVCEDESSSSSDTEGAGDPVGEETILWQPLQGCQPLHLHQPLHLIQTLLQYTLKMDCGRRRPAKRCSELLQILPNNDSDAAERDNDESGSEADWVCEDESSSSSDTEGAADPVGEEAILKPTDNYKMIPG
ncbi:UNVERIFIED_CONTAM: hypothetical protein FKN15_016575 [Acipenser sinensis]